MHALVRAHALILPLLAASFTPILAQSQLPPAGFVVQGNVPGSTARKAFLTYGTGDTFKVDSVLISNGHFQFAGTAALPMQANLYLLPATPAVTPLYVEPGTITVSQPTKTDAVVISGTPLNLQNAELKTQTRALEAQLAQLNQRAQDLAAAEWPDTAAQRQTTAQLDHLLAQRQAVYAAYIQAHPAALLSLFVLDDYEARIPNHATYAALFQTLAPGVRTSPYGRVIQAKMARYQHLAVGALAPAFSLPAPDGQLIKLAALRGRYVLVDFWASWCKPCRAENPTLAKAYATYKNQRFTALSISLDKSRAPWLKAIAADGMSWPQASPLQGFSSEVARSYNVASIPQNFLVDPQGRIIAIDLHGEALLAKLAQVLRAADLSK